MTVGLARGKPAISLPGLVQRQLHDRLLILFGVFTLSSTGSRGAKKTDSRACLEIAFEYQPDLMQNAAIDIIGRRVGDPKIACIGDELWESCRDRKSVVLGRRVSVSVDIGGGGNMNKKKK